MSYGLPRGTNITYGSPGFPPWVYQLADTFNLKASTYPGHQENHRNEPGFAPNPGLNRGIDWTGTTPDMQRFAEYLRTIKPMLEQVIWENPTDGRRVGIAGGRDVSYDLYYAADMPQHRDHVHTRQSQPLPTPGKEMTVRPDFNEYPVWSRNNSPRSGTKPDLFLLHTQESGTPKNGADNLARWMQGPVGVSYHYTISQDPQDQGVTVCDVVDTDLASWSVLSANPRSINLCFAGSKASWSRDDWLKQSRAIDVAAYLAVQDCRKYNIPFTVIPPPYTQGRAGISDHRYVTRVLKDGTHTDVGDQFPWDVFISSVNKYAGITKAPEKQYPRDWTDRQLLEEIWKLVSK